jgi:hypothetical protein
MSLGPGEIQELAHQLVERGPRALEVWLAEFVRVASAEGVDPVLLAVLADRTEPDVVRQRAFGRAAVQLALRWQSASSAARHAQCDASFEAVV